MDHNNTIGIVDQNDQHKNALMLLPSSTHSSSTTTRRTSATTSTTTIKKYDESYDSYDDYSDRVGADDNGADINDDVDRDDEF